MAANNRVDADLVSVMEHAKIRRDVATASKAKGLTLDGFDDFLTLGANATMADIHAKLRSLPSDVQRSLLETAAKERDMKHTNISVASKGVDSTCFVCMEPLTSGASSSLPCGHRLHSSCLQQLQAPSSAAHCPVCRALQGITQAPAGAPPADAPPTAVNLAEPAVAPHVSKAPPRLEAVPPWAGSAVLLVHNLLAWVFQAHSSESGVEVDTTDEDGFLDATMASGDAARRDAAMGLLDEALMPVRRIFEARARTGQGAVLDAPTVDALLAAATDAMSACCLPEAYAVRIAPWAAAMGLRPHVNGAWPVGMRVMLADLVARPQLNGVLGTCREWVAHKGRFAVDVDGQGRMALRPENLRSDPHLIESAHDVV